MTKQKKKKNTKNVTKKGEKNQNGPNLLALIVIRLRNLNCN